MCFSRDKQGSAADTVESRGLPPSEQRAVLSLARAARLQFQRHDPGEDGCREELADDGFEI